MPLNYNPGGGRRIGPISSFISGLGAGEQYLGSSLKRQVQQTALDREREKQTALKAYRDTGDVTSLYPVMEPKEAALLPKQLEAAQLKQMGEMADFADKRLLGMELGDYPAFRDEMITKFPGVNQSLFPPPERFGSPEEFNRYKTAGAMLAAKIKQAASPYMGRPVTLRPGDVAIDPATGELIGEGEEKERQVDWFATEEGDVIPVPKTGAVIPPRGATRVPTGRGGAAGGKTGSNRFASYADYKADVRAGKHPNLPADASEDEMIRAFNRAIQGGKAAGTAEFPKPAKPLSPQDQLLQNVLGTGGQPAAPTTPATPAKTARPYAVKNKKGEDVTNQLSDAEYQQILKAKGLK